MAAPKVMIYDGMEDLRFDQNLQTFRKETSHARGSFIFDPEDFKEESKSFLVQPYQLPKEGLLEYAKLATQLRQKFQSKADAMQAAQPKMKGKAPQ